VDLMRRPVGNYSATISTNPYFETDTAGWVMTGGSQARVTDFSHEGAASNKLTPNGSATAIYAENDNGGNKYAATQGVLYSVSAWIRPDTGNKTLSVYLHWFTSGNTYISSTKLLVTPVATAWHYLQLASAPVSTAAKVTIAAGIEGVTAPAGTDIVRVDEVMLTLGDNGGTWVRVATGLGSNATYDDWQVVSGVPYEYSAVVYGTNATSIQGPWKV